MHVAYRVLRPIAAHYELKDVTLDSGEIHILPLGVSKQLRRRDGKGVAPLVRSHTAIMNDLTYRWVYNQDSLRPIALRDMLLQALPFCV